MKDVTEGPRLHSKLRIGISDGFHRQQTIAVICVYLHVCSFISTCYPAQTSQPAPITAQWLLAWALIPRLSYYPEIFVLVIVILGNQCQKVGNNWTTLGGEIENGPGIKNHCNFLVQICMEIVLLDCNRGINRVLSRPPVSEYVKRHISDCLHKQAWLTVSWREKIVTYLSLPPGAPSTCSTNVCRIK